MSRTSRVFIVIVAALLALPLAMPSSALATVDSQRAEVERVVDELDRLHEQADILAEQYNVAVQDKAALDEEIESAKASIAEKEGELGEMQGAMTDLAVRSYTGAGNDVLGPLFSNAESYTDQLQSGQLRSAALDEGAVTTDDLEALVTELTDEREALDAKLAEQEALVADIEDKRAETERLTGEYGERRQQAEARLGELIAEEEQRRAEEAWERAQAELAQQQANASANNGGNTDNGGNTNDGGDTNADNGGGNTDNGGNTNDDGGGNTDDGGSETNSTPAPPPPPQNTPSVSGQSETAVAAAMSQQGVPYVYATSKPGVSFDCSGLTHYAWAQAGVYLPRNSAQQAASVPNVPAAAAQPGDLIFYYSPISHVGIYLGGGQLVHAPNSGSVVNTTSVSWDKVTAVGRPG